MTMMTPDRFIRSMRRTPVILNALLQPVSADQARVAKDGPDGWSVSEVMGHLKDYEEIYFSRAQQIAREDNPRLAAHNQEELVRRRGYAQADVHELFRAYLNMRREFIAFLESLSEAQWQRRAIHPQAGDITLVEHAMGVSWHDVNHIEQIVRALGLSESLI